MFLRPVHLQSVLLPPGARLVSDRRTCPSRWLRAVVRRARGRVPAGLVAARAAHPQRGGRRTGARRAAARAGRRARARRERRASRHGPRRPRPPASATPFQVHFESLLPRLTGRRLYAGMWDGYQWTPARRPAPGRRGILGRAIEDTPPAMSSPSSSRWGVGTCLVWSDASRRILPRPEPAFADRGSFDRWTHFEFMDADPRSVVTVDGTRASLDEHWRRSAARSVSRTSVRRMTPSSSARISIRRGRRWTANARAAVREGRAARVPDAARRLVRRHARLPQAIVAPLARGARAHRWNCGEPSC